MWRFVVCLLLACKGDAPPSPPPQPPGTFRIPIVTSSPPALVAVRDDAGTTWQALAPRDNGYDVPLAARFTLLVVCAHWGGSAVELRHWTRDDNRDFRIACEGFDGESLADVKPVFAPSKVVQTIKTGGAHEVCASNTTVCSLRAGTHDAVVLYDSDAPEPRVKIHRGLSIFDSARVDADASRGWQFERRTIEIDSSIKTSNGSVYVCLETESGDAIACAGQTQWGAFPAHVEQTYTHVPEAHRVATDCDVLDAPGTRMCLRDVHTRIAITPRPVTMERRGDTLAFDLADADALSVQYRSRTPKGARWSIVATRRWLAGATTYTPPEVTVPGWRGEWSLSPALDLRAALVWGPKPSSHERRARVSQRLAPGDRIDTHAATIAED